MIQEAQVHEKAVSIRRLLDQIALLSKGDLPLPEYFDRLLDLTTRALDANGGTVWLDSGKGYQPLCSRYSEGEPAASDSQMERIQQALASVAESRAVVVETPNANGSSESQRAADPSFP